MRRIDVPASLAGLPAISFPCGFTKDGMPVGMQFVAPPRREGLLLAAAHAWQRATDHHLRRPAR
jgi:Asp-tRNA(Asn)/Glu-tRNA(Gln) amidotransferase A subunit family amidase